MKGRGSSSNPVNRFERQSVDWDEGQPSVATEFLEDSSRSLITYNRSPDVGFNASLNPYRGCEHGCSYCYARPTHEYLGFSAGLDFETKIMVKREAPNLLRKELAASGWEPQPLALSGVTDAYQPVEKKLSLTRACLQVLVEFLNPVIVITKNALVTRDKDLLQTLSRDRCVAVFLSVTTLDNQLAAVLEPRAARPARRLQTIEELRAARIPCGVLVAPVIPGLTDYELPSIIAEATSAGAQFASYTLLRLPGAVSGLFERWLQENCPNRSKRVLSNIREMRSGHLNDSRFGSRMRGQGVLAEQIRQLFGAAMRRNGLEPGPPKLDVERFRRSTPSQPSLL